MLSVILVSMSKTLGIITPYQPVGDKNVRLFFNDAGYEIKNLVGLRCENANDAIALVPEHEVMDVVRQVDGDDVDAIVQVGTNLSTADTFPHLENVLGKPCIPINVATIWQSFRDCGIQDKIYGKGRLFEEF